MPRINRGPDFLMMGMPRGDEKTIIASTSLYEASWAANYDWDIGIYPFDRAKLNRQWFEITAQMHDLATATGPDYPTALARLLGEWSPDPTSDSPLALPPGRSLTP